MYLIIDGECRVYKTKIVTGYLRNQCRRGNCNIINLRTMQGMNSAAWQASTTDGKLGLSEYSDIQEWDTSFKFNEVK